MLNNNVNLLIEEGIEKFLEEESSSIQIAKSKRGIEIVTLKEDLPVNVILGVNAIDEAILALTDELLNKKTNITLKNKFKNLEHTLNNGKIIVNKCDNMKTKLTIKTIDEKVTHYTIYSDSFVSVLDIADSYFSNND